MSHVTVPPGAKEKAYRFDARLSEAQKTLIQRAAYLEGRSVTDFVLQSAQSAAERAIQEHSTTVLNVRDAEIFVEAILNPPRPGKVLRRAIQHYRKTSPKNEFFGAAVLRRRASGPA